MKVNLTDFIGTAPRDVHGDPNRHAMLLPFLSLTSAVNTVRQFYREEMARLSRKNLRAFMLSEESGPLTFGKLMSEMRYAHPLGCE